MATCIIFGGAGFMGTHMAKRFLQKGVFSHVHVADLIPSSLEGQSGLTTSYTDVRRPIPSDLTEETPEWIFNLAAVHREPGHGPMEYFQTNLNGAREVGAYAEKVGCANIYFTSSISVYSPSTEATDEYAPICPVSPYGGSKYPAELIHEAWQRAGNGRRLLISRPGVIYGPGDPGNILRMIQAVRKGYFVFPGSPRIYKSYGYIEGFLDSVEFFMQSDHELLRYNYVEYPTEPFGDLVDHAKRFLGSRAPVFALPLSLLKPVSHIAHYILREKTPIHPVRVQKAAMPTHIIPKVLRDEGFAFRFDFPSSLRDWYKRAPEDFDPT